MAVWTSVLVSAIEYSRIDADFYHPTYLDELNSWRRLDERVGATKLGQVLAAPVRTGRTPTLRRIEDGERCVHFIKTDTVREGSIVFSSAARLPARVVGERDIILNDAVLMTIIGATPEIVGRAAIKRFNDPECVTNQNVAVISTNGSFDPYFLTAYFQTKWGRSQVWRHSRQTEQVNLNCREVERVLVPNPPADCQAAIGGLVRGSLSCADRSEELYQQAEQLLEAEIGLNQLTFQKSSGYVAQFSDSVATSRMDADYFQPQYAAAATLIKSYSRGYEPLLACCNSLRPNIDPSISPQKQFSYIELAHINSSIGTIDGALIGTGIDLPSRAKRQVVAGDVVASAVVGSVDKVAIVANEQDGFLASTGFFHLRPLAVSSEYLLMLVRSQCVRMQFQQQATGGILSAVPESRLKHVLVPKLAETIRDEIADLVRQSHAAKRESVRLLDQAKSSVEKLIDAAVRP